jgi:hypothetical protein
MANCDDQLQPAEEAIGYFRQAIIDGKHWYIALLETIGLWSVGEETDNGRTYQYLIAGEAFDWLLLAERLCEAVDSLLPESEKVALLFYGEPPLNLTTKKFRELIGSNKYHQYLNYFYGITVEEALVLVVKGEVRKERHVSSCSREGDIADEAYQRIYGDTGDALLEHFRDEKNYPRVESISLTELKEFTYWLFKYRLKYCDKAKVGSDTAKALEQLRQQRVISGFSRRLVDDRLLVGVVEEKLNSEESSL